MTGKWRLLLKMKKKKNLVTFFCLAALVFLSVFSLGIGTLAWFVASYDVDPKILGGTAGTYFESGDGSEEKPYIISNPRHLYNLAWLQYLGEFNKDEDGDGNIDKQYYFKIKDGVFVLNMSLWALPPIGTTRYPFVGNFNGNGCTIQNLSISNSISDLSFHPLSVSKVQDCSIIGFFGVVGSIGTSGMTRSVNAKGKNGNVITADYTSYTEETGSDKTTTVKKALNSVHDYYLDNETIISNPDAPGSSSSDPSVLTGFLVGYANGEVKNAGLHSGTMELVSGSKSTNIKSGSGTDASNISDNISDYTLIGAYDAENYNWQDKAGGDVGYGTSTDMYELYTSLPKESSTPTVSGNSAYPFRTDDDRLVIINGIETQTASTKGNNIGYFSGNGVKIYANGPTKQYVSSDFTVTDFSGINSIKPPKDVLDYLNEKPTKGNDGDINGHYLLRLTGQLPIDTNSLKNGVYTKFTRDPYTIKGNYAGIGKWRSSDSKPLLIPQRCIYVAPISSGKMRFVIFNPNKSTCGFVLYKLKRNTQFDYSSQFVSIEKAIDVNGLISNKPYYFEYSVDYSDGYEYALAYGGSGVSGGFPYFAYIDMGAIGDTAGKDGDIKNIDFVTTTDGTDNGSIVKMTDSTYTKSGVLYQLNGTATSQVTYSFKRSDGPSDTNVKMIRTSSPVNGVNLTVIGNENQAIDRSTAS